MPEFLDERYEICKATPRGRHATSVPSPWLKPGKYLGYKDRKETQVLYDSTSCHFREVSRESTPEG